MPRTLTLSFALLLTSATASAMSFTCNLQKVPGAGRPTDPAKLMKVFRYDSFKERDKSIAFEDLKVSFHTQSAGILVKLVNARSSALTRVSSRDTEIYVQLNDDAIAVCNSH